MSEVKMSHLQVVERELNTHGGKSLGGDSETGCLATCLKPSIYHI